MWRLDQAGYSTHFLQMVAGEGRDSGGSRQLNQAERPLANQSKGIWQLGKRDGRVGSFP
jgi:hypothetical protein